MDSKDIINKDKEIEKLNLIKPKNKYMKIKSDYFLQKLFNNMQKKIFETDRKIKKEKESLIDFEKHKKKTDSLAINYQKRIRKFIIDVR